MPHPLTVVLLFFLIIGLVFVFACTLGAPAPAAPAQPAIDSTKVVLELEATAMVLQMTQSALENQSAAPPAAPTQAPQQQATAAAPPTVAPPAAPAMSEDFDTWMKSASILLFEDMAGSTDRRRYISGSVVYHFVNGPINRAFSVTNKFS